MLSHLRSRCRDENTRSSSFKLNPASPDLANADLFRWTNCPKRGRSLLGSPAPAYEVIRQQLMFLPHLQGAVNMALLDIVGKQTKAPVYQVLGGPTRNKARAVTPLAGATGEALLASMQRAQEAGFRAFLV